MPPDSLLVPLLLDTSRPLVRYKSFSYQAGSWTTPRRIVAKVEHHAGELFPRIGFIVTNLRLASRAVVRFYNRRCTAEQWIKESDDVAADLGAAGPGGLTRDDSQRARLAKKGHKRGELVEKCLGAMVFQAILSGHGRSRQSRELEEWATRKSGRTRRLS